MSLHWNARFNLLCGDLAASISHPDNILLEIWLRMASSSIRYTRASLETILLEEGVSDADQRTRILDRIVGAEEKEPVPEMDKAFGHSPNAQRPAEGSEATDGVKRIPSGLFGY